LREDKKKQADIFNWKAGTEASERLMGKKSQEPDCLVLVDRQNVRITAVFASLEW